MVKKVLIALLVLFAPACELALAKTTFYEPEKVELPETITKATFPEPPGYESIIDGDRPEQCWILNLNEPIELKPTTSINVSRCLPGMLANVATSWVDHANLYDAVLFHQAVPEVW
jgi:hypothetical protein